MALNNQTIVVQSGDSHLHMPCESFSSAIQRSIRMYKMYIPGTHLQCWCIAANAQIFAAQIDLMATSAFVNIVLLYYVAGNVILTMITCHPQSVIDSNTSFIVPATKKHVKILLFLDIFANVLQYAPNFFAILYSESSTQDRE